MHYVTCWYLILIHGRNLSNPYDFARVLTKNDTAVATVSSVQTQWFYVHCGSFKQLQTRQWQSGTTKKRNTIQQFLIGGSIISNIFWLKLGHGLVFVLKPANDDPLPNVTARRLGLGRFGFVNLVDEGGLQTTSQLVDRADGGSDWVVPFCLPISLKMRETGIKNTAGAP